MAFLTPILALAGAALIAIPIAIHLLNRRRFKTVPWAAMQFLLAAMKRNRRRLRFESWLLLAVRCMLLVLLGAALARPVGCGGSSLAALAGQSGGLHVVVLDSSYSMGYREGSQTRFDIAKDQAKAMLERLAGGANAAALVVAESPARAELPAATFDMAAASLAVDRVSLSSSGTDLAGALERALEVAETSDRQPRKTLHIWSDRTNSAWRGRDEQRLAELGPRLQAVFNEVIHHDPADVDAQWNAAVVDIGTTQALLRSRFGGELQAMPRSFGRQVVSPLQWRLDGQIIGSESVAVDAQTPPQLQPGGSLSEGGLHTAEVTLAADDPLPADDTRLRVAAVASQMPVLIVEGRRGMGPLEGSGAFLELALAPPTDEQGRQTNSYLQVERVSDLELGGKVLDQYRVVILAGVGGLTEPAAAGLERFVQEGGVLMLFMGESVATPNYNAALLSRGLLPGPLVRRVTNDEEGHTFDFRPLGDVHPYLRAFRNITNSGLETARVFSYLQAEVQPDRSVERVLNFAGSADPAITTHPLGEGRVVFIATSADGEWNSLTVKPAFIALMHELLSGAVGESGGGDRWLNLEVGERLVVPSSAGVRTTPSLRGPRDDEIVLETVADESGIARYRSAALEQPGFYRLQAGDQQWPVAVNLPAGEADLRPIPAQAITELLGGLTMEFVTGVAVPETAAVTETEGADYGWALLLAVLCLAAAECVLAMWFGHGRGM